MKLISVVVQADNRQTPRAANRAFVFISDFILLFLNMEPVGIHPTAFFTVRSRTEQSDLSPYPFSLTGSKRTPGNCIQLAVQTIREAANTAFLHFHPQVDFPFIIGIQAGFINSACRNFRQTDNRFRRILLGIFTNGLFQYKQFIYLSTPI